MTQRHRFSSNLNLYAPVHEDQQDEVLTRTDVPTKVERHRKSDRDRWSIKDSFQDDEAFVSQQRKILEQIQHESQTPAAVKAPPYASLNSSSNSPAEKMFHEHDGNFTDDFLRNQDLILEQCRILEAIQRSSNHEAQIRRTISPSPVSSFLMDDYKDDRKPPATTSAPLVKGITDRGPPNSIPLKPPPNSKLPKDRSVASYLEDTITILSNGKKLRLKGTRHVYEALKRGTCVVVQCYSCQTLLQVPDSSTALYCVFCQQVTPMELARSASLATTANTTTTCTSSALSSSHLQPTDAAIAESLQRQELEAALSRHIEKSSRHR